MEANAPPKTTAKRVWHIVRAVFLMLREGLAKTHLFSDLHLHLLFRQGKLAGKSLRSILSHHHHHSSAYGGAAAAAAAFSCRYMDPDAAIIAPREVEFSCSSTPFYAAASRRRTHHGSGRGRRRRLHGGYEYDAAAIARAFEILDSVPDSGEIAEEMPTPVPSLLLTPASVRPLRVSDSPFPVKETEETDEAEDLKAEEFIQRFYEQLRRQHVRTW
ncbi:hypothetical protein KSP39_PZI005545 [Platanthera zijinensis]|uniref:Avr9/Cf-9 rapidly elicited protein 146 n=1 Tax=Platanthera zijinensis TaxID=2320716 RepID=A0AAP0BSB0_9ASPA